MKIIQMICVALLAVSLTGCSQEKESQEGASKEKISDFDERELGFLKEELRTSRIQQQAIDSIERELEETRGRVTELKREVRRLKSKLEDSYSVTILGAVNRQGTYTSSRPLTLLEAFGYAGGLQPNADAEHVIYKEGKLSSEVNCVDLINHGRGNNHEIPNGLVLIVPEI